MRWRPACAARLPCPGSCGLPCPPSPKRSWRARCWPRSQRYPALQLDITVTDEAFDIVGAGFDAGVRLGEVIAQDMVAVPVSARQRQLVVCSPDYRDAHVLPTHPRELGAHRCIGWRSAPGRAPYRWEFEERGREFSVDVQPEITSNDMGVMLRLALAGAGLAIGMEETWRPWLQRGELVPVLEAYCPRFAGFSCITPAAGRPSCARWWSTCCPNGRVESCSTLQDPVTPPKRPPFPGSACRCFPARRLPAPSAAAPASHPGTAPACSWRRS